MFCVSISSGYAREPHGERRNNLIPRCAPIRGIHKSRNVDWWDAKENMAVDAPLSLWGSLGDAAYKGRLITLYILGSSRYVSYTYVV